MREYEYLLTQKLILSPEIEMNFYSKDDEAVGIGSGLSDMSQGLRLRYEIKARICTAYRRQLDEKFGQTANFYRDEERRPVIFQFVVGIRAWF